MLNLSNTDPTSNQSRSPSLPFYSVLHPNVSYRFRNSLTLHSFHLLIALYRTTFELLAHCVSLFEFSIVAFGGYLRSISVSTTP
jgi:hypothetical protein